MATRKERLEEKAFEIFVDKVHKEVLPQRMEITREQIKQFCSNVWKVIFAKDFFIIFFIIGFLRTSIKRYFATYRNLFLFGHKFYLGSTKVLI